MIPVNPAQIPALYKQATGLHSAGRFDEARAIYNRILIANARLAEVHFQLARLDAAQGNPRLALEGFEKALTLKPGEAAIWAEAALALRDLGDAGLTRDFLARAKKARLDPRALLSIQDRLKPAAGGGKSAATRADIGTADPRKLKAAIDALNAGRPALARQRIEPLLAAFPKAAGLHNILSAALAAEGRTADALRVVDRAIALAPDYAEAHAARGRLLNTLQRPDDALAALRKALALLPNLHVAWVEMARLLARRGDARGALRAAGKAADLAPPDAPLLRLIGDQQMQERDFIAAEGTFRQLVAMQPDTDAYLRLAQALGRLGRSDAALEIYDRLLADKSLDPNAPPPGRPETPSLTVVVMEQKASLLQTTGAFDKAQELFLRAQTLAPLNTGLFREYVLTRKFTEPEPVIERMQAMFARPDLNDTDRMNLGFGLAKVMEDLGRHDRVMSYLHPANAAAQRLYPFDMGQEVATVRSMTASMRSLSPEARPPLDACDLAPIFVTGMPRSGTTLVEQILASHSTTQAVGEVGLAARDAARLLSRPEGGFRPADSLTPAEITGFGHQYGRALQGAGIDPDGGRVIDKSIQSYRVMPLLRLAMPRARVVVVRRDPRDTLLSIYRNSFPPGTHEYAYDLKTLGAYYRLFDQTIEAWRRQFPDWFVEIAYEDLVADPEPQIRRLLAACDLPFEPGCLASHKSKRDVRTLSVYQVRQPIYASSVKGWERYKDDLAPMLTALDAKEDDDVAE